MALITVVVRTLHLLAAAVWVGGSVTYLLVITPALSMMKSGATVGPALSGLFRRLVNICIGIVLLTGVYLTFDRLSTGVVGSLYIGLLVVKVTLALAMTGLAIVQAQEARRSFKHRGRMWKVAPRWILALGLCTFLLGAALVVVYDLSLTH